RERQRGDGRNDVDVGLEPQARGGTAAREGRADSDGARLRAQKSELDSDRVLAESEREAELVDACALKPICDLCGDEVFAGRARGQRRGDLGARAKEQARERAKIP